METVITIIGTIAQVVLAVFSIIIAVMFEKRSAKGEEKAEARLRIDRTIRAYNELYLQVLAELENYGTPGDIKKAMEAIEGRKQADENYKTINRLVYQLEIFVKCLSLNESEDEMCLYDWETFKYLANPYFAFYTIPRVKAFLEVAVSETAYPNTRKLIAMLEEKESEA